MHYPIRQPSWFAEDHAQAHTTVSTEVFRSHDGFLLTVVAAGQQMIPGTEQCQSAVDRSEQCVFMPDEMPPKPVNGFFNKLELAEVYTWPM